MSAADGPAFAAFVAERLAVALVPGLPELKVHLAGPATGLRRLAEVDAAFGPPYWAFLWGGGLALAHHLHAAPEAVAGKRVLDLGTGSGLVAVAAAKAGAARVLATDADPYARAVAPLNAALNGVAIEIVPGDPLALPPPEVDVVLAGDVFYAPEVAARVAPFLDACRERGATVLVGDPGRRPLPRDRLVEVAEYQVSEGGAARPAWVFVWA